MEVLQKRAWLSIDTCGQPKTVSGPVIHQIKLYYLNCPAAVAPDKGLHGTENDFSLGEVMRF